MRRAVLTTIIAMMLLVAQSVTMGVEVGALTLPRLFQRNSNGYFYSACELSHRLPDDPIVAPRRPGASHSHDFFGNTSTNAHSTYDTLRAALGNCHRMGDAAGYWVPTLYDKGRAIGADHSISLYGTGGKAPGSIRAFPAGLKVIAGNSRATANPADGIVSWSCHGTDRSTRVPFCGGGQISMHINFPDCWNGRDLDSPDHKSHLAYATGGVCPAGYGTELPQLLFTVKYQSEGGPGITFSSGPTYTAHADFLNAWDQRELQRLVRACLNRGRECGGAG